MKHKGDILIVDDELALASVISEMLSEEGFEVRTAYDGRSALDEVLRKPPALILMDYWMPTMTGQQTLDRLRSLGFDSLPVIIMSAYKEEARRIPGAVAFLPKPFAFPTLVDYVRRYARSHLD